MKDMAVNDLLILDTTLRDGEQSPGCTMSIEEKLELGQRLADLGVNVIEAGFPAASPGDFEAVRRIAEEVRGPVICGLARAMEKDIDACGRALYGAIKYGRGRIHTFIGTSQIHMEEKLKMTPDQVVEKAVAAVSLARRYTDNVEFSCEDAGRSDINFLRRIVLAAIEAGAGVINLPDTTGYCQPDEVRAMFEAIGNDSKGDERYRGIILSCHCHNDLGKATANSLAAISGGARQVECTINGIGERAGNCALEEVVMNLIVRRDRFGLNTRINSELLGPISRLVSHFTGQRVQRNKAIVGANAFAHEAGIHQDGVIKNPNTYEIMSPASVGWEGDSLVLGKHSGRAGFNRCLAAFGYNYLSVEVKERLFEDFIDLCDRQKVVHEDDILNLVDPDRSKKPNLLSLEGNGMLVTNDGDHNIGAVWLRHNGNVLTASAIGDGPVDALVKALVKATGIEVVLESFLLEALGQGSDTAGQAAVTINILNSRASGRAADTNIDRAALRAVLTAVNRILAQSNPQPPVPDLV